jgi:CRP-like cAMP-binding protein
MPRPRPEPDELATIPLFADVDPGHLSTLAEWFDIDEVDAGQRLTIEGAAGYAFFVLRNGAGAVTIDHEQVATLGPGDFFGEIAILGGGRRTATVTATEPSTVWSMFGTRFRQLEEQEPDVAATLRKAVEARAGGSTS